MRKSVFLLFALCSFPLLAQKSGGITDVMLEQIRKGYSDTPSEKAVRNALAGQSIASLAVNADNLAMIDTHFTYKVPTKGITNQKSSGRCWLFTGLNVLRAKMIACRNRFDFSSRS